MLIFGEYHEDNIWIERIVNFAKEAHLSLSISDCASCKEKFIGLSCYEDVLTDMTLGAILERQKRAVDLLNLIYDSVQHGPRLITLETDDIEIYDTNTDTSYSVIASCYNDTEVHKRL